MPVYSAEAIDIDDLETLLDDNWETYSGAIPKPTFATTDQVRFDPSDAWASTPKYAAVNILMEDLTEQQEGYAYAYVRQRATVSIDIWARRDTANSGGTGRQYMHDIKQEIRRIVYANKHSLSNWQLMRYMSFRELYEDSTAGRFHGQIRLQLENDGVPVEPEDISCDEFDRSDGGIGSDWNEVTGTWEVDTNKAKLASSTADAIVLYTPSGITFGANHTVRVDITTANSMDAGIVFRYQDSNNYWYTELEESAGVKYLRLHQVVSGSDTKIGEVREPGWADGDVVQLEICYANTGISVLYNGLAMIQLSSTVHQTETGLGLRSDSDTSSRFDNFCVFETGGAGR